MRKIAVIGAGITGIWQALTLARRGHAVTLIEKEAAPFAHSASSLAAAMLAPYCEAESAEPVITKLGLEGLDIWKDTGCDVHVRGSLVVAKGRDKAELARFARMTEGHEKLDGEALAALEPQLGGSFRTALFYPQEAHLEPRAAVEELLADFAHLGGDLLAHTHPGMNSPAPEGDFVIDCRGMGARKELDGLRGVRGETVVVRSGDVSLSRPVRLAHPRFPLYVVPRGENRYMIGATVIEREDAGAVTVRSALDLLSAAYAVHPGFGEAEILSFKAGVRPAFPDNVPKIIVRGSHIYVNGLYRHGFLLAPVLARMVAEFIEGGGPADDGGQIFVEEMV